MIHHLRNVARQLRSNMTDAERFVWQRLRYKQLDGFRFRRQFPLGNYLVDFVCIERKLIVELDGGQHAENVEADQNRTAWLNSQGFQVLRFWNHEAMGSWETVEQVIWKTLRSDEGQVVAAPPP